MKQISPFGKVKIVGDCWEYTGSINNHGYGSIGHEPAHRRAYRIAKGPIPKGKTVHHTCENRKCIKPGHFQLETMRGNLMASDTPARQNARKMRCPQGHLYAGHNLSVGRAGDRRCKACANARYHRRRARVVA